MTTVAAVTTAAEIAELVNGGKVTAREVAEGALARLERLDPLVNAFSTVTADRALLAADAVDARRARGDRSAALAGVPFAVKDLFDLQGVTTAAGSVVLRDRPPAEVDAAAVQRLMAQGAVPIGATVMDEFAFGFTTENSHDGPARNPHDPTRSPGGSSGGSAAAVAAGIVPLTLGTDTNGSIRVPASLCGLYGLKPTYGSISRAGMQLFSDSLDHVGAFARSAADLALAWTALADPPPSDRSSVSPLSDHPRVGILGGWFAEHATDHALAAVAVVGEALGADRQVLLPSAQAAHAAASVITYAEAGELHLDRIRNERPRLDPVVRPRLVAGALLPADWYVRAQRLRALWIEEVTALFDQVDIVLAPATPFVAPTIGTETVTLNGRDLPARPAVGWLTQPLTPSGVPIGVAPIWPKGTTLPIGVQVIAPHHHERWVLDALRRLELAAVTASPVAGLSATDRPESST